MIGRRPLSARKARCSTTTRAPYQGFATRITFGLAQETKWVKQELASPRVPIVRTFQRSSEVEIEQEAFVVAPPLASPRQEGGLVLRAR